MALRIRAWKKNRNGQWAVSKPVKTVCAAEHPKKTGDIYVADDLHYFLVHIAKVLHTKDDGKTWIWKQ